MVALKKLGADLSGHDLSMVILVLYMQRQKLQVVGLFVFSQTLACS